MQVLFPYLAIYKRYKLLVLQSIILSIITFLSNISLLTLSSWFLSASATAGFSGIYSFNFMLPAAGVRIASIIRTAGRYFERLISHDATFRVLQHLRVFVFSKLFPLSPSELTYFHYGELLNRIIADIDTLDRLYLRIILPLISAFFTIIIVTLGLSILDPKFSLILGVMMLLIFLFFPPIFYQISKPIGEKLIKLRGKYRNYLIIWLQSQAELTVFGANKRYLSQMKDIELSWYKIQRKQSELTTLSQSFMQLISALIAINVLWMTANNIEKSTYPSALIALFTFCSLSVFETISTVSVSFQYIGQVVASAFRITQITNQKPEINFGKLIVKPPSHVMLQLHQISFSYKNRNYNTLKDFSLKVMFGEHVAILGRTGCGKSTLLHLLTRAWDPQIGSIFINNTLIKEFSEKALRKTVSIVTQRVYLFSGTLRDNLLLDSSDTNDKILQKVLYQVGLKKLLEDEGLNTWLGEGGRQLSSGELRRLSIARVLLYNTPLILLDEPTENLDAKTETQIIDLLNEVMKEKTVLMVTHRLYGLENFHQIVIMDNGKIIEKGNHKDLLNRRGYYYQFKNT